MRVNKVIETYVFRSTNATHRHTSAQGRCQSRTSGGAPTSGRWARGGCEQMSPLPPRGSGCRDPRNFLYIFDTKSCILMHFLAPKMGTISVFIKTPGGNEECWRRLLNEDRRAENRGRRPREGLCSWGGVGFLGRGQQAPPTRRPGSDVNKTKFLRPRPK